VPIGRPISNARLHVLDAHGGPVPIGVAGELYIAGSGLARGYLGRPDLTAETLVPNPFAFGVGERLYRTGDRARSRPDGAIEFMGRIDHQVKIRGFRIELGEIEAALSQLPGVGATVVMVREVAPDDYRLVAYVTGESGPPPGGTELRVHLQSHLPDFMIPTAFVLLEALPLTPNGKVDRRELARYAGELSAPVGERRPPRTPVEEILAGIWSEVLKSSQVWLDDNFFQIGGHSLIATRLISRVRETFRVELPLRSLFDGPRLTDQASLVEAMLAAGGGEGQAVFFRRERGSPPPLSLAQERFWEGRRFEALTVAPNNLPTLVRFEGPLDVHCLRQAVQEVVDRHEVLRTNFREGPNGPIQVIHPSSTVEFPMLDLARLDPVERMAEVDLRCSQGRRLHFDYEQGPLFRLILFRGSDRDHLLFFVIHHIAFDGWSRAILISEVSASYQAFCEGRPSPHSPLAIQYQDFSRWQRQTLEGEALVKQVSYWRRHLEGASSLDLQGDRPLPARRTFAAGFEGFVVPKALEDALETFAANHDATLFMVLLSAFYALLGEETGQRDIVIICLFANRNQAEVENLIGNFYAGLPLRARLSEADTFSDFLRQVRNVTLAAHEHPDILYEAAFEELSFHQKGDLATFRVLFQLAKLPTARPSWSELKVTELPVEASVMRKDLSLFMSQVGGLGGRFRYNRDVLDPETVIGLRDRYLRILTAIVAESDSPVMGILMENAAEAM
ncbi:MAG TPA: condensation domain-containing protein, partial [Thermoanaerobaculia bacterium]|nr:condensation domain-containing protein [Thermoanaerobaculia bacterium]